MRTFVGAPPGDVDPPDPGLPTIDTMTSAPNGGFSPSYVIAGAVQSGGKVFVGLINGSTGAAAVVERDETTGTETGPTTLRTLGADAHNSPALLVRSSDSRIVTVYCAHSATSIYRRISTNPEDSTSWGTETNLDSSLTGTHYTNPQLHQLNSETNDPVYLFYRNEPTAGTDSRWQLSTSTDGGSTFGTMANIYHIPGKRSYLVSWSNGEDRIDFLASGAFSTSPYQIGHFYYEGGSYFKSDGTSAGSPPIQNFANITEIATGGDVLHPGQVVIDSYSGTPVVLYYSWNAASTTFSYWYGRWNGTTWDTTALVSGTAAYNYNVGASDGMYGAMIDDGDVNTVYLMKVVSGQPELFRLVTTDDGATFTEDQVTTESSGFQSNPIPVRNRGTGLVGAYQYGTWTYYLSYSLGIKGIVLA
jgi:hypothetical protein